MEDVIVLLSTYNGEKYLRPQIDSILSQTDVRVKLLVRDDGSTDRTCLILKEYEQNGELAWYTSQNLKPSKSFFHLLCNTESCKYYAFADQDDIWHKDKLSVAIGALEKESQELSKDMPLLYFCNKNIVDAEGKLKRFEHHFFSQSIERAFLECFASGCCMVFNHSLRSLVMNNLPTCDILHDHWVYILANIFGKVVYDDTPMIDYRQHANNVVGAVHESKAKKIGRLFIHKNSSSVSVIAKDIMHVCGDMLREDDIKIIRIVSLYKSNAYARLRMFISRRFVVASKSVQSRLFCKLKILFGAL